LRQKRASISENEKTQYKTRLLTIKKTKLALPHMRVLQDGKQACFVMRFFILRNESARF
jgi:hypothetical protein